MRRRWRGGGAGVVLLVAISLVGLDAEARPGGSNLIRSLVVHRGGCGGGCGGCGGGGGGAAHHPRVHGGEGRGEGGGGDEGKGGSHRLSWGAGVDGRAEVEAARQRSWIIDVGLKLRGGAPSRGVEKARRRGGRGGGRGGRGRGRKAAAAVGGSDEDDDTAKGSSGSTKEDEDEDEDEEDEGDDDDDDGEDDEDAEMQEGGAPGQGEGGKGRGEETGADGENSTAFVPVLYDDVPHRISVKERDEWLDLFQSCYNYTGVVDPRWVRRHMSNRGAEPVDRKSLNFMCYLFECYMYKVMDHVTDWTAIRLEAEMEERDPGESKTRGADVDRMMRRLNFTIEEEDVLHAINEIEPNADLEYLKIPFKLEDPAEVVSSDTDSDDESGDGGEWGEGQNAQEGKAIMEEAIQEVAGRAGREGGRRVAEAPDEEPVEVSDSSSYGEELASSGEGGSVGGAANQAGGASGGAGGDSSIAGGGDDEGGGRGGVGDDDSVDFDQFVQAELMTELPDADPDAQIEGYYPVVPPSENGCMLSLDDLELLSPIGTELQPEFMQQQQQQPPANMPQNAPPYAQGAQGPYQQYRAPQMPPGYGPQGGQQVPPRYQQQWQQQQQQQQQQPGVYNVQRPPVQYQNQGYSAHPHAQNPYQQRGAVPGVHPQQQQQQQQQQQPVYQVAQYQSSQPQGAQYRYGAQQAPMSAQRSYPPPGGAAYTPMGVQGMQGGQAGGGTDMQQGHPVGGVQGQQVQQGVPIAPGQAPQQPGVQGLPPGHGTPGAQQGGQQQYGRR